MDAIQGIPGASRVEAGRDASGAGGAGEGFSEVLGGLLRDADRLQKGAEEAVQGLATGRLDDVHDVVLALNKAELSFRLMLEVRNRLVEAYQEVTRMTI